MDTPQKLTPLGRRVADRTAAFFAAVPGSLRNHLNTEELSRIVVTSLSAGGGVFGALQAVLLAVGVIFPAPTDAALAAAILAFLLEMYRRLGQGRAPSPEPRRPATRAGR